MVYQSGKDWKGVANPNMNIKDHASKGGKSKSPTGKFKSSLNIYKRDSHKIPEEYKEMYEWYIGLTTKQIDALMEIKNIYRILKANFANSDLPQKIASGEKLTAGERDQFRLMMDAMEKSNKIEFGDKKTVEHKVTYEDVRKQIFSNKTILNAKVLEDDNRGDN